MRWIKRFFSEAFWEDLSESNMKKTQGIGLSIIMMVLYGVSLFVVPWAQNHIVEWSLICVPVYLAGLCLMIYG